MDKNSILKIFSEENPHIISKIIDDIELCFDIDFIVFSNSFYPANIWTKLLSLSQSIGINIITYGLNNNCEKKLLGFYPKTLELTPELLIPDITFFKIDGSNKFNTLLHKDFLGAIMSLSIKRELLGDLVVKNNICYGVTTKEIFKILKDNLKSIGKVPIDINEISNENIPKTEFQPLIITVASLRFDVVIAEIAGISRNEAVSKIENGEALLNYNYCRDKSFPIKENDVITIRKKGKFIFESSLGENKKGKFKLAINQVI